MIVSWDWLRQYVALDMPREELERRLMMAGLNHESTEQVDGDWAIDLEVTSNRPDCLGHIGVAREVAVLWEQPLRLPATAPAESGGDRVDSLTSVDIECPMLCSRYTARVIRNVRVGPSPDWLRNRLQTVGLASINNIVDITNYVMLECGQPLHAFDFAKLRGRRIVVREPRADEQLEAIDHHTYKLQPGMCVIADAEQPVGIGGVMGGADTEVGSDTRDLLIEAAEFDPTSIRRTARALGLHSDSSYRFERGIDPEGVDWASRRACELILELAGGELAPGVIDVGTSKHDRAPIALRYEQLPRILGIDVPRDAVSRILVALGINVVRESADRIEAIAPSWRRDLTREIDLIEEVARIHGYDTISEDVSVPMARSARTREDRVLERIREVMVGSGFDEALTPSAVEEPLSAAFSPWTDRPPLQTQTPVLRRANQLRRSLVPSLLEARRTNESVGNEEIELFEIAHIYLPSADALPKEPLTLGVTSGRSLGDVKGVIEALCDRLQLSQWPAVEPHDDPLFWPGRAARYVLDGEIVGFLGEVSESGSAVFGLRGPTTVCELSLASLIDGAQLITTLEPLPQFPAIARDVNLELDEGVLWADVEALVRQCCGALLERLDYLETYRDQERLGPDRKSLLFKITLRDAAGTLTGSRADEIRDRIVTTSEQRLGARLRSS